MLRKRMPGIVTSMLVLAFAATSWAGIPDLTLSTATTSAGASVSLLICPLGDGDLLTSARLYGGGTTDATVTLTLLDGNTDPIPGYLATDLWLDANGIVLCTDGSDADADTDVNGITTWTGALAAGGCSDDGSTNVWVNGSSLLQAPLSILMNSPDMNGDLIVNLTDVVLFAGFYNGAYAYCADFYWDGILNLSDIVLLAQHIGHTCP
jgi:hypothetical protein